MKTETQTETQTEPSTRLLDIISKPPMRGCFIFFIIILLVFLVIIVVIIVYNSTYAKLVYNCMNSLVERTIRISFNVVNSLTNKITIGTSLGDFIANLYNAFAFYDLLNVSVYVSFDNIYNAFTYWLTNNDYNNVYFREDYYNEQHYETLPFYMADYKPTNYNPQWLSSWNSKHAYGYELYIDESMIYKEYDADGYMGNSMMKITKIHNTYTRLELETTPFTDYKDKFMRFVFENITNCYDNLVNNDTTQRAISLDVMFKYYQYFIIIHKIKREFYDCTYFDYIRKIINNEVITSEDNKDVHDYYTTDEYKDRNETIDLNKKRNLCYVLMTNTYNITYTNKWGEEAKINNIRFIYNGGFTFYKDNDSVK